jgi:glycerol-3-phosphate O-acyltransferase
LNIIIVNDLLRSSGAFFMRRTFKGDDLYKALFTEYVKILAKDKMLMEFFIEGTRSRTNKIISPKYGFLGFLTGAYFDRDVDEITVIPLTINYMRTLEGETFPLELTGADKVKETLGRIVKAAQIIKMTFGSIYMDFCDPITVQEHMKIMQAKDAKFNPYSELSHRRQFNENLAYRIIYTLQDNIRIMPTTLVASMILMFRKGINEKDLTNKVIWLGQTLKKKGILVQSHGLPTRQTVMVGLSHLKDYLEQKRDMYEPGVTPQVDYSNYLMLWYYRNPLNFIFLNEACIISSLFSWGEDTAWEEGVSADQLFERAAFISNLIKKESVL